MFDELLEKVQILKTRFENGEGPPDWKPKSWHPPHHLL
jgi:hypothetical protein